MPSKDAIVVAVLVAAAAIAACDRAPSPAAPTAVIGAASLSNGRGVSADGAAGPAAPIEISWPCLVSAPGASAGCLPRPTRGALPPRASSARAVSGPPANLSANVAGSTVTLTWEVSATGGLASSYVIEAGSGPGLADLASFDSGSPATSLVVTSVPTGTYFVRVRGRSADGTGPSSNEVTVAVGVPAPCASAPGAPTGLSQSVVGATLTLTWAAPSTGCVATAYRVQAGSGSGLSDVADVTTGDATTWFSAGDVPDGTYYLRVRGVNGAGLGPPSNEVVVMIGAGPLPDAPVLSVPIIDLQGVYDPSTGRLGSLLCTFKFANDPNDRWCFHAFGSSTVPGKVSPSYDYKTVAGAMVVAATAGTVTRIEAESNPLYPGEFEIETRATSSFLVIYDHVKNVTVTLGSVVSPGSPLGTVGIHTSGPTVWGRAELQVNRITQLQPTIQSVAVCPRDYGTPSFNGFNDAALGAHNDANPAFAVSSACVP